ncbi:hypothetical protein MGSAQ_000730, partial [marine sediment metagenome]
MNRSPNPSIMACTAQSCHRKPVAATGPEIGDAQIVQLAQRLD